MQYSRDAIISRYMQNPKSVCTTNTSAEYFEATDNPHEDKRFWLDVEAGKRSRFYVEPKWVLDLARTRKRRDISMNGHRFGWQLVVFDAFNGNTVHKCPATVMQDVNRQAEQLAQELGFEWYEAEEMGMAA